MIKIKMTCKGSKFNVIYGSRDGKLDYADVSAQFQLSRHSDCLINMAFYMPMEVARTSFFELIFLQVALVVAPMGLLQVYKDHQ